MAIARDIEQVNSNWTGGTVGSGVLKRGNVGDSNAGDYNGPDPDYEGAGAGTNRGSDSPAKLILSNGEEIWDFSGNVWEWVDDKIECGVASCPNTLMPYDSSPAPSKWVEYTDINTWGKYSKAELASLGTYTGSNGVGRIYTDYDEAAGSPDIYTHAFRRGGSWNDGAYAGVFALALNTSPSSSYTHIGFRCAR